MPEIKRFHVGMVGYGIGKIYAAALRSVNLYYPDLPPVELVGVATTRSETGQEAVRQFGFAYHTTDYHELLNDPGINLLVLAAPNSQHHHMLLEALEASQAPYPGAKAIFADKPLAVSLAEARQVADLAASLGRDLGMAFEFRQAPALQSARRLVEAGVLGELYAFRGEYLRSSYIDPQRSLRWKAEAAQNGGALGDLIPHIADLLGWLTAQAPARLSARQRTFVHQRPAGRPGSLLVPVETDDHVILQLELRGGAIGTLEAGRMLTGAVNDISIALYGSRASLRWSLMDGNYLYIAENPARVAGAEPGWRQVPTVGEYPGALLPPADLSVGVMRYHVATLADFLRRTATADVPVYDPGLRHGLAVQELLDAAARAAAAGQWVDL